MSGKNKVLITGILFIIFIMFFLIEFLFPKINIQINGKKYITISLGDIYTEEGAIAYTQKAFNKKIVDIKIKGTVDTTKLGTYIISYQAENGFLKKETTRVVKVIDDINPEITLNKSVNMCQKNNLVEIDAKAFDNYDGDISKKIKYKIKNDKIYISVLDSSKNKAEIEENINYIDEQKPMLTLNGPSVVYLTIGEKYEELGAKAYDSCDGNITNQVEILGNIDTTTVGSYQITYLVKDSLGNEVKIQRTIVVNSNETEIIKHPIINGATIYLTFDDGPGPYTKQILEVLNNYNVKATFFVTNQFPDYQNLIKDAYEQGHSIGIHTYSHKWTIYESVESYLSDYKKIEDLVYNEIGIKPKIFRFPGGSSNTISKNYKKGIMTELAKIMTEKGYVYFDWTFDSGDTNKKDRSKKAILKNIKNNLKGDGDYIVLLHDIKKNTLESLPEIIEYALYNGYTFAALDENSPTVHLKIAN